jgi:prophage regulatory protein
MLQFQVTILTSVPLPVAARSHFNRTTATKAVRDLAGCFFILGQKMNLPTAANDNVAQKPNPLSNGATLLRLSDVILATSIGSSTIYRKIAANQFPRPLRLGPGSVRWRASEVVEWIDGLERTGNSAAAA